MKILAQPHVDFYRVLANRQTSLGRFVEFHTQQVMKGDGLVARGGLLDDPERVFEAFYTTKKTGMGMGLAISRTIIQAHPYRRQQEIGYSCSKLCSTTLHSIDGRRHAQSFAFIVEPHRKGKKGRSGLWCIGVSDSML